jgi:hypothetical protein
MTDELRRLQATVDDLTRACAQVSEQCRQAQAFRQVDLTQAFRQIDEQWRAAFADLAHLRRVNEAFAQIVELGRIQEVFAEVAEQWRHTQEVLLPRYWQEAVGALAEKDWATQAILYYNEKEWQEAVQAHTQAAAGFAAAHVNALGVGATAEDPDMRKAGGIVHVVSLGERAEVTDIVTAIVTTHPDADHLIIALPPAFQLNRAIKLILTPKAYRRIIEPTLADWHYEYFEALKHHQPTRWIAIRMHLLVVWSVIRLPLEWLIRLRG